MFILRKITKAGLEMNFSLGNSYTLVDKERNPEHFRDLAEHMQADEKTYAIICNSELNGPLPLYVGQMNYIMTEGGKTFANVTQQP